MDRTALDPNTDMDPAAVDSTAVDPNAVDPNAVDPTDAEVPEHRPTESVFFTEE